MHAREMYFRTLLNHVQSAEYECRFSLVVLQKCPADIFSSISALFCGQGGSVASMESNFATVKPSETKGGSSLQTSPEYSTGRNNVCSHYLESVLVENNLKYSQQRFSSTL